MRKWIILIVIVSLFHSVYGQVLLETTNGDEIAASPYGLTSSSVFGSLNVSEQSLQFKTIFALPNKFGVLPNSFFTLGIKGKPSDGIFTLFSGGNFNPSTNVNLSYTKINLFSKRNSTNLNFIDFFTIKGEFNVNKQTLFNADTIFSSQVKTFNFKGGGLSFNYNALVSKKHLINFSIGYVLKNNYSKLETMEIQDYHTITDTITGVIRQYGKKTNGKIGNYKEFESFPMRLSYTYCPSEAAGDVDKLKFGFSIYYASEFGKFIPSHNLGTVVFLTKQDKTSGVRAPIIGIGIQANDITDNQNKGNTLIKRITLNLTTVFNLTSF